MLEELGISNSGLANLTGLSQTHIDEIIDGQRLISEHTALRLGQALRMSPEFWLNLQRMCDFDTVRASTKISKW